MDSSLWRPIVQWIIWAIVMALVLVWVRHSRAAANKLGDSRAPGRMVLPTTMLILGIVGVVLFTGCIVAASVSARRDAAATAALPIFVALALLSLWALLECLLDRHEVSDQGLTYRRTVRANGHAAWSDVQQVVYSDFMKWWVVRLRNGESIHISALHTGQAEFARQVLQHADDAVTDPHTAELLADACDGRLPQLGF
ncbi:hypothetical protein [Roseateles amylovorans]|uniref:PH domain-containing protein n=1 Tax=Roseateles amylovorans TaxID=2978473 RepID=A0ABY6AWP6_9BURK|nr:hypothetical protein [Roseateles amylovorans]UXH77596.1 hypothetical protein N4261_21825 [Roseateles amylovorans]